MTTAPGADTESQVGLAPPGWIGAEAMARHLPMADAIDVLEQVLRDGFDPEHDGERTRLQTPYGQLLQMPSADDAWCGTKLVSICPGNEGAGLPVIQGVYVLFDGPTLRPVSLLDGGALTTLRTPAVTGLAVRHLAPPRARRLTVFGTGVQARAHIEALAAVLDLDHVDVVGRTPSKAEDLAGTITDLGISAATAGPESVGEADVIVCCTSAREPLFDGSLVAPHALVAAIGAHDTDAREVDSVLVRDAACVVESRSSAQREAGDVMIPVAEGVLAIEDLIGLRDVVRGAIAPPSDRPRLFKGTGMPWQDLAVSAGIYERAQRS